MMNYPDATSLHPHPRVRHFHRRRWRGRHRGWSGAARSAEKVTSPTTQ
ncbi:hypothetical protein QJS66_22825 [Kocuria rhizophila]|nr:hypothetical protein QJS66_22825 [Kocuria rhizophila]